MEENTHLETCLNNVLSHDNRQIKTFVLEFHVFNNVTVTALNLQTIPASVHKSFQPVFPVWTCMERIRGNGLCISLPAWTLGNEVSLNVDHTQSLPISQNPVYKSGFKKVTLKELKKAYTVHMQCTGLGEQDSRSDGFRNHHEL